MAAQEAEGVTFATAAELRAAVARPTDGLATAPLPSGPGVTALTVRRIQSGVVEVHDAQSDIIVAQTGRAILSFGGTVAGGREVTPGEHRGGTLMGTHTQAMGPGDVVWIPAGVPHLLTVGGADEFNYLAFKFPTSPVVSGKK